MHITSIIVNHKYVFYMLPAVPAMNSEMYVRGTNNEWEGTVMSLVSAYTWQITTTFGDTSDSDGNRFKFCWSQNSWYATVSESYSALCSLCELLACVYKFVDICVCA